MEKNLKAIISNRIFLSYTDELLKEISQNLTYKVPPRVPGGKPEIIRNYSVIGRRVISIPVGRKDLIPADYKVTDKRTQIEAFFPETVDRFIEKLRPSQKEAYDLINDNYIVNAKPGWGKTFTAIATITKLLQKSLIIVHTVQLREQWENEIRATLGIEPGIIGSGKFIIDKPIVVANIQSLKKYASKIKDSFGTVIVDEAHHTPASTFREFLDISTARYKIGLSGTLFRKDGKHVLLFDYISQKTYTPPKENVAEPIVLIYKMNFKIPGNFMNPWATRVNMLTNSPLYRDTVLKFATAQADRGHKVLVVSDRVEFLHDLDNKCDNSVCITSKVNNRLDIIDEFRSGDKNILFGSINIFKEGMSINEISCLIVATAVSNEHLMTQLVGRIIRLQKDKIRPEVIDIAFTCDTGKRQLSNRLKAYRLENYEVRYIN